MKKLSRAEKIRRFITANPDMSTKDIATKFDTSYQVVYMVRTKMTAVKTSKTVKLPKGEQTAWIDKAVEEANKARQDIIATHHTDMVNHPPHYKMGGIETIDFIEAKGFGYNLGNVVKYVSRADHKGSHYEDLLKARWYLNREIAKFSPQTTVPK
jgi:hypothetical protein